MNVNASNEDKGVVLARDWRRGEKAVNASTIRSPYTENCPAPRERCHEKCSHALSWIEKKNRNRHFAQSWSLSFLLFFCFPLSSPPQPGPPPSLDPSRSTIGSHRCSCNASSHRKACVLSFLFLSLWPLDCVGAYLFVNVIVLNWNYSRWNTTSTTCLLLQVRRSSASQPPECRTQK